MLILDKYIKKSIINFNSEYIWLRKNQDVIKIEFIISSKDLENLSFPFERNMNIYETNLFEEKKFSSFYSKDGIRKDISKIDEFIDFNGTMKLDIKKNFYLEKDNISDFNINGSFKVIYKKEKKYIQCLSNILIENGIFGKFELKKDKFYSFNLETVGRDPKLKRNNLFIAKRRIYQLIQNGNLEKPEDIIEKIIKDI